MKTFGVTLGLVISFVGGYIVHKKYGETIEKKVEDLKAKYKEKKEALSGEEPEGADFDEVD